MPEDTEAEPVRRSRSPAFSVIVAVTGLFLLLVSVPNIGPAVRAARGDGVPGVFTAQRLSCTQHPGHEACTWYGDFRAGNGGDHRSEVYLYGAGRDFIKTGEQTKAIDTGRRGRVYGPTGSREWVFTVGLLLAGLVLVGVAARPWLRRTPRPAEDVRTGEA